MSTQNAAQVQPPSLLKISLLGNAAFSLLSGFVFVLAPAGVAELLGVAAAPVLLATGLILIPYAAFLFWVATRRPIPSQYAILAILLDLAWVAGSAFLLLTNLVPLAPGGKWAVAIVADIVALFALIQFVGLRRIAGGGA